jgi:hypothetical protein
LYLLGPREEAQGLEMGLLLANPAWEVILMIAKYTLSGAAHPAMHGYFLSRRAAYALDQHTNRHDSSQAVFPISIPQ